MIIIFKLLKIFLYLSVINVKINKFECYLDMIIDLGTIVYGLLLNFNKIQYSHLFLS